MKEQKHEWHHGELLPVPEEVDQNIIYKIIEDRIAEMNRLIEDNERYRKALQRMFTSEDMVEFAEWFSDNWDLDFAAEAALIQWSKNRESK